MKIKGYLVWRLNPEKGLIAPLRLPRTTKNFALDIQRLCRAAQLGHRHICDVDGIPLYVAADAAGEEGQPGFRFRGASNEITAGIGVLFGMGENGGLISAPVDRKWLDRHVVWATPQEADADPEDVPAIDAPTTNQN